MLRRLLLIAVVLFGLAVVCSTTADLHDDMTKELDDLNKEERESKEPVRPGGPLSDTIK